MLHDDGICTELTKLFLNKDTDMVLVQTHGFNFLDRKTF